MKKSGLLLTGILLIVCQVAISQVRHRFSVNDLKVEWKLITNGYNGEDQLLSSFIIANSGKVRFPGRGWKIYFCYNREIFKNDITGDVEINHLNGDLYRLSPNAKFRDIKPGSASGITYLSEGQLITYTSAPSGLYLVWDDEPGKGISINNYTVAPIHDSTFNFITPENIYKKNQSVRIIPENDLVKVFPTPIQYKETGGIFQLDTGIIIRTDPGFMREATFLSEEIGKLTGTKPPVRTDSTTGRAILLKQEPLAADAYTLETDAGKIEIRASSPSGIFYGIQSLRTLIPPSALTGVNPVINIPAVSVNDAPRFGYRALLLDVARNFQPRQEIFKILDLMALYKLNVLHLHFSDDEGWRIEIPSLPELTEVGSRRGHTTDSRNFLPASYGSGPVPGILPGSGFYSKQDFIEILRYATERHIMVVPEIESPGHSRAAIKAMDARYEKFMAAGNKREAEKYLLRDMNDKSEYVSAQLWTDNVMCVALPSVYSFLGEVIDRLVDMYSEAGAPLRYIHMGGDEVPQGTWERSPLCNDLIKNDTMLSCTDDLWYYYYRKVNSLLRNRNLALMGWEEAAMRKTMLDGVKHYIPNPDFVNQDFSINVWNNGIGWGSEDLPYRLANAGYKVILSCVSNNYLDLAYEKSPEEPGYYWGGFVDTEKPFYFIPFDYYKNTREDVAGNPVSESLFIGKDRLTDYGKSNILGIQGLLWAENLRSTAILEYMLLPKLLSIAERCWSEEPAWSLEPDKLKSDEMYEQAWSEFVNILGQRELPRLDWLDGGFNYRIPAPGAVISNNSICVNYQLPGFIIRYTTDGTEPDQQSNIYSHSIDDKGLIKICAFSASGRKGRTITINNP